MTDADLPAAGPAGPADPAGADPTGADPTNADDFLLDRLRRIAVERDDPPDYVDRAARAALSTRRLDHQLAQLIADSAQIQPATRAGEPSIRLLTFETATVSLELQVDEVAGRRSVRGHVTGASGEAVVETAADTRTAPIDERGWFAVDDLPAGVIRIRLQAADGTAIITGWVS
jgi:hypothetical protein